MKDSSIFYKSQIDICKRHLNAEQFGRLMYALFELDEGSEPDVDDDIIIAFEFMSLQKRIDRDKYEERCRKNRENGKKGGRPPKTEKSERLLKKPNGYFKNPNDNENENDNENDDDNENDNIKGLPNGIEIKPNEKHIDLTDKTIDELKAFMRGKS